MTLPLLLACTAGAPDTGNGAVTATTDAGLYELALTFDPAPVVGEERVALTLSDDDGAVADAAVTLTPFMPAHGHGASDVSAVTVSDGVYSATWTWPMAGAWELTVEVSGRAGDDRVVLDVDVG